MTDPLFEALLATAHKARRAQLAVNELSNPANAGVYYLSFATEEGFLGGAFVEAHGIVTAVDKATDMGINPGGEVMAWGPVPPPIDSSMNRLLTKEEVEASPPKDSAIIDIADERHLHQEDDECGEVNSSIDYGKPCIRFKGHDEYDGQRNHITESSVVDVKGHMVPDGPCIQAYPGALTRGELIECEKTTRHWKHKGHDHWTGKDGKPKTGTLQWWGGELTKEEQETARILRGGERT